MINTVESLRGLYVALGGDLSDVANITTIPEMLSKISLVAQAAATELPVVSGADDGDVLGVVSGKWAKMTPPTELPAVSGTDNGKLLGVSSGAWNKVNAPAEFKVKRITASGTTVGSNVSISLPSGVNRTALSAYDGYDTVNKCGLCVDYSNIYLPFVGTDIVGFTTWFSGIGKINNKVSKITVGINHLQASNDVIYVEEITFS